MKKIILLICVLILGFGGYIIYDTYFKNKVMPKIEIEEEVFNVTKYYIYGTHLNIEGNISLNDDLSLVLYNGEFIYIDLITDNDKYIISNYVNDGLYLDDIELGKYYLFVSSKYLDDNGNEQYKYYALNNTTDYNETVYYSMSNYNKKIIINSETEYPTMMMNVITNNDDDIYDIVIDPGHGGMDGGASSGGYSERDFTMDVALKVKEKLNDLGVKVKLTREEDSLTRNDLLPEYGVHGRAVISSEAHAKYLFSIHMNSNTYSSVNGLEVYTAKNINYDFAKVIVENIINKTGLSYSLNRVNKMYNSIYTRNFTSSEIQGSIEGYDKKGINAYEITTNSNYYYIIRETGGIITGAYVDDRNENLEKNSIPGNPSYNSNIGTEAYLLELGYITNPQDRENMINNIPINTITNVFFFITTSLTLSIILKDLYHN
mgnify:CR=1 FL=1